MSCCRSFMYIQIILIVFVAVSDGHRWRNVWSPLFQTSWTWDRSQEETHREKPRCWKLKAPLVDVFFFTALILLIPPDDTQAFFIFQNWTAFLNKAQWSWLTWVTWDKRPVSSCCLFPLVMLQPLEPWSWVHLIAGSCFLYNRLLPLQTLQRMNTAVSCHQQTPRCPICYL